MSTANLNLTGNLRVQGDIACTTLNIPPSTVTDTEVSASANIAATKLEHQHCLTLSDTNATAIADKQQVVHVVKGATGTLVHFEAGAKTPHVGNDVSTVDLLINGTSALQAAISLSSAQSTLQTVEATIQTTALTDGDVLEIKHDYTHGTGTAANGVFATLVWREQP